MNMTLRRLKVLNRLAYKVGDIAQQMQNAGRGRKGEVQTLINDSDMMILTIKALTDEIEESEAGGE